MNLVEKFAPLVMGHKYYAAHQIKRSRTDLFAERFLAISSRLETRR
jgi:hypothetical protein